MPNIDPTTIGGAAAGGGLFIWLWRWLVGRFDKHEDRINVLERESATREDVNRIADKIDARFDRLEANFFLKKD